MAVETRAYDPRYFAPMPLARTMCPLRPKEGYVKDVRGDYLAELGMQPRETQNHPRAGVFASVL